MSICVRARKFKIDAFCIYCNLSYICCTLFSLLCPLQETIRYSCFKETPRIIRGKIGLLKRCIFFSKNQLSCGIRTFQTVLCNSLDAILSASEDAEEDLNEFEKDSQPIEDGADLTRDREDDNCDIPTGDEYGDEFDDVLIFDSAPEVSVSEVAQVINEELHTCHWLFPFKVSQSQYNDRNGSNA